VDYAEVCGQEHAKRALEIAAAGGHNLMLLWSPTLLICDIGLPPLSFPPMDQ
jgi:magnesium chelatase family protein